MVVFIASMNMRGKWADRPANVKILNVTSMQGKKNKQRLAFSPMTIDGGYRGYCNFESFWQSGKVWEGIPHEVSQNWWKKVDKPRRRYYKHKGRKVLRARFDHIDKDLDYVESRKLVYIPLYYEYIINNMELHNWIEYAKNNDVVVYDFDGPRDLDGNPICVEMNLELLKNKVNDTRTPFGHGYIVAAALAGIASHEYTI